MKRARRSYVWDNFNLSDPAERTSLNGFKALAVVFINMFVIDWHLK